MRSLSVVAAGLMALCACSAHGQVTGVVTSSTATIQFRGDVNGNPIVVTQSGDQIGQSSGSEAFGAAGTFASTSKAIPGLIAFQNGNASTGAYAYSTSQTDLDITFKNDGDTSVTPQLNSEIAGAGIGLYVSNCYTDIQSCPEYTGGRTFQSFSPNTPAGYAASNDIAGAMVEFKILGNGQTLYDLTAAVTLAYDPVTGKNVITSDVLAAAATLNGFTQTTAPGSQTEFGYGWGTTDLAVNYPAGTVLAPGQSATLTYQTTVESFSRETCYTLMTGACVVSYSSFGDPIGRGGGVQPSIARNLLSAGVAPIDSLTFGTFGFSLPTFQDGQLTLDDLHPIPAVIPEPATWMMMLGGLGLVGFASRRRLGRIVHGAPAA